MADVKDVIGRVEFDDSLARSLESNVRATEKMAEAGTGGISDILRAQVGTITSEKMARRVGLGVCDQLKGAWEVGLAARFPKPEASVVSDEFKRPWEAMSAVEKSPAFGGLSITDELRRSSEGMSAIGEISKLGGLDMSDELKRSWGAVGAVGKLPAFGGLSITEELRRSSAEGMSAIGKFPKPEGLDISDELKRSLARTSLLAHGVDDAISRIRIPDRDYSVAGAIPEALNLRLSEIEPAPNPIFETNSQLAELTGTVAQLVDVAKRQAELTQAIKNRSDLATAHAIQSAGAATRLARTSVRLTLLAIIVSVLTSIGLTVYGNHRQSVSAAAQYQEDVRSRQEEIRVLREISSQLNGLNSRATMAIPLHSRPDKVTQ